MSSSDQQQQQQQQLLHRRAIRATTTTDRTIRVYQAYNDEIADGVLAAQSFQSVCDSGIWSASRMTWIKPSKVWMAYRCGWTTLKNDRNQCRVLALDLDRDKFWKLLEKATLSHGGYDLGHSSKKCRNSSVVVQWDPERVMSTSTDRRRDIYTKSIPNERSIQIGLRPPANECLLDPSFVLKVTDVTQDFRSAITALKHGGEDAIATATTLLWPKSDEQEMELDITDIPIHVAQNLSMIPPDTSTVSESTLPNDDISPSTSQRRDAIVVLGCTANPPHQGHLHCLRVAKAMAEQNLGYNVVFTTIAVAPYGYVRSKMSKRYGCDHGDSDSSIVFDDTTRLHVLERMVTVKKNDATDGTDENDSHDDLTFRVPTKTYGSALECGKAMRSSDNVTIIIVVGGDRFAGKWRKANKTSNVVTICCARGGEGQQIADLQSHLETDIAQDLVEDPNQWHIVTDSVGPSTSSTLIRSILIDDKTSIKDKRQKLKEHGYQDEAVDELLLAVACPT